MRLLNRIHGLCTASQGVIDFQARKLIFSIVRKLWQLSSQWCSHLFIVRQEQKKNQAHKDYSASVHLEIFVTKTTCKFNFKVCFAILPEFCRQALTAYLSTDARDECTYSQERFQLFLQVCTNESILQSQLLNPNHSKDRVHRY